jgi:hypothetical protein
MVSSVSCWNSKRGSAQSNTSSTRPVKPIGPRLIAHLCARISKQFRTLRRHLDGGDGWYVSDAAANAVLHVDRAGRIRTVAVLASTAPFGGRPAQGVPTGLGRADDGTLYVALFGGAPATGGPAVVVALRPGPDGGRSRPAGVARAVAPIGVTAGPRGLAVLDYGGGPADRDRGRILLVARPADPGTVAATGLDRPVGMARLPDGRYVVAETDRGRLRVASSEGAG